ncbi:DEAD/DEAH box helicase [Flavobacterium sp. RHBU_3]|uniref:DEAD/DEAH box helicase n=1 Tax=Flavobacterium sp. RHBU_3 TaxID=3391184 RepID=UPI0039849FFB
MKFEDLNLISQLQQALADEGYEAPTPIQQQAIPIIIDGKDLVGCAQTGTGKTAAFAIPIINNLHPIVGAAKKVKYIRTLVVTPTRELALQIATNFDAYAKYTNIRTLTIFGGVNQNPQVDQLKKGVDVLVATPGRLLDLHKQGFINLDHMHHLVLDEADQMLDMGFINDVKKIIKLTPDNRQTLLFSATMPLPIRELADSFLTKPEYVSVTPISSTAEKVKQHMYLVGKEDKRKLLYHLIRNENLNNVLIFTRTKHGADNVVKALKKHGVESGAIHGDKSQSARQRVLDAFKNKEIPALVATDIAARGIDIESLPYVINFDLPNIPETYVHRIGRTGRAGNSGLAISFCGRDELPYLKDIEKLIGQKIKVIDGHPYPYSDEVKPEGAKPDFRNKKKNPNNNKPGGGSVSNNNSGARSGKSKPGNSNSRKSAESKKNKKRWY